MKQRDAKPKPGKGKTVETVPFEPTVESLKTAEVPEWFQDGKLGIFMHWGPQSIPGVATTWYARWIYEQDSEGYKYHCATYGHPSKFGYKDICKLFKAAKFDQAQADKLVALYKKAGARYVVPVAVHHDNFDMWDSKFQPRWNSMATAGKDVVGMWQKATVANGLHFGVASHAARSYRWLQTSHGSDKTGPLAGVPYDGQDPANADLYGVPWNSTDYGYEGPQDVGPPEFEKNFEDRMLDLIDRYHPDLYYTDGGPPFKKVGYNIVAHMYNESRQANNGKLQAVATFKGGGIGVENHEFGYPDTIMPAAWQTDKTVGAEWYWLRDRRKDYKKANEVVHTLVDVVSKNGNLLLNVPLTPDGELEEEVITMLNGMGHDLDLIGEAVFSTRPWEVFGEGPNCVNGLAALTPLDVRFTRNLKKTVLYATFMGWPGDGATARIRTLNKYRIDMKGLQSVSLLGTTAKLKYVQDADGLKITFPAKAPYECSAYAVKFTFSGQIPKLKPASQFLLDARVRSISGAADCDAYDLPTESGVLIQEILTNGAAAAGIMKDDVILTCNGTDVPTSNDLRGLRDKAAGAKLTLGISRKKNIQPIDLRDYVFVLTEAAAAAEFKTVPLVPSSGVIAAKVTAGGDGLRGDPVDNLVDGKVTKDKCPIYANGVVDGAYKLDLGEVRKIAQVNTFSSGGQNRARQNFVLYGSSAATDPGWNVADAKVFTPIVVVDTRQGERTEYEATSIRRTGGQPLGSYRWLVWAVSPVTGEVGGENTAFQEMQVLEYVK